MGLLLNCAPMNAEIIDKISYKYRILYAHGIQPEIIIVGKQEKELLNGQQTLLGCRIMVDENSPSRCDAYGNKKMT